MSNEPYIKEFKELVKIYGIEAIARALGKTERGMKYWTAEVNAKVPAPKTRGKIHELFEKHKNGQDLFEGNGGQENALRNDLIQLLKEKNARLQKEVEINLKNIEEDLIAIAAMNKAVLEILLILTSEKKAVYNKSFEVLKKYGLEGIFG